MALSKTSLKQKSEKELKAQGFVLDGELEMAEAIANAVGDEIIQNAEIKVTGGSSSGSDNVI